MQTAPWSADPSDGRAAAVSVLPGVPLPPGLVTFTPDDLAAAVDAAFPEATTAPERSADELVSVGAPTAVVDAEHVIAPAPPSSSRRASFAGLLRRGRAADAPEPEFDQVPVDPGWQDLAPEPVVPVPAAVAPVAPVAPVATDLPPAPPAFAPPAPSAFAPPAPVSDEDPLLAAIPVHVVAEAAAPPSVPAPAAVLAPPVGLPVPLPPPAAYVAPAAVTPPPPYVPEPVVDAPVAPEPVASAPVASFAHLVPTQQLTFPASMEAAAAKVAAQIAAERAAEADDEARAEVPEPAAPSVGLVFADGSHAEVVDGPDSDALQHVAGVLAGDEPAAPIE